MKMRSIFLAMVLLVFSSTFAFAGNTSAGLSAASGESSSAAYKLYVLQQYEPLISGELGELTPTGELAVHYWTKGSDEVWGGSLAPGLRFTLFTDSFFHPFLAGSVGGIALSDNDLGPRDFDSYVLFRSQAVVGVEFGEGKEHRVQGEYNSYSTWGISDKDDGYSTVGASYNYSF